MRAHSRCSGAAALAAFGVVPLPGRAAAPAAPAAQVSCLVVGTPSSARRTRGPCLRAEPQQVVPLDPPAAASGQQPHLAVLVTNFGMLLPGERGYELVCEEMFGGTVPDRVARHPDGRLLIPAPDGLYLLDRAGGGPGCGVTRAGGSLAGREVVDVAAAPARAGSPDRRIWALTPVGDLGPAALHASDDGVTFEQTVVFAGDLRLDRLVVAPSDPNVVYVSGYRPDLPLVLARSEDGGNSFSVERVGPERFERPATVTKVLGVHPAEPGVLLLGAGSPDFADEIWRSTDGGRSWARVFGLRGGEVIAGFAWPEAGQTVYVAGLEPLIRPGRDKAHLYVSGDEGAGFPEAVSSGETGLEYRCLAAAGGRLYACDGSLSSPFFFGISDDRGRSWTALARLSELTAPPACAAGSCVATTTWLCDTYGAACDGVRRDGGVSADAAARSDAPPAVAPGGAEPPGCGCQLGSAGHTTAGPAAATGTLAAALFLIRMTMRRARQRRTRSWGPAAEGGRA